MKRAQSRQRALRQHTSYPDRAKLPPFSHQSNQPRFRVAQEQSSFVWWLLAVSRTRRSEMPWRMIVKFELAVTRGNIHASPNLRLEMSSDLSDELAGLDIASEEAAEKMKWRCVKRSTSHCCCFSARIATGSLTACGHACGMQIDYCVSPILSLPRLWCQRVSVLLRPVHPSFISLAFGVSSFRVMVHSAAARQ
jgi:hypothetical protein